MSERVITISRRYCGPPNSANGGYAAGSLARFIDGAAEVTLHRPPPLDTPLRVVTRDDTADLFYGDTLIAAAVAKDVRIAAIDAPNARAAADAAARTFPAASHALPTCFVCGPLRDHGDGLRLHVGPVDPADSEWNGVLAAPWVPAGDFGDDDGLVRPEIVWAALDCPTAYACGDGNGMPGILLGRQSVSIFRRPAVGETCVVAAQYRGQERRKHFSDATLTGSGGELLAVCKTTWIEVSDAVLKGEGLQSP